jgi:hypothetical protein
MPWCRRKRTIVMRLKRKITVPIAINRPIGIKTIPQIIAVPRTSAYSDTWSGTNEALTHIQILSSG